MAPFVSGALAASGPGNIGILNFALTPEYGSIVQIEARHAAAIGLLVGEPVAPDGRFDRSLTEAQVLAKAKAGSLIN